MGDMLGERFGRWVVIEEAVVGTRGERKWLCRCDCGTERYVLERNLRAGASVSCGCLRKEETAKARRKELAGMTFGALTVLRQSEQPRGDGSVWWVCQCECGAVCEYRGTMLTSGKRRHCGGKGHRPIKDITGQRFQQLTALYPTEKRDDRGGVIWHCRCDCGQETEVSYNLLLYSNIVSCGCRKQEHTQRLSEHLNRVAGTSVDRVKSKKVPVNSSTGYRGVYQIRGKYVAKINFQKKSYYLGAYTRIEDAVKVRQTAEKILFDATVDFYNRWQKRAALEPEWAERNPIQILVTRQENEKFAVTMLPEL